MRASCLNARAVNEVEREAGSPAGAGLAPAQPLAEREATSAAATPAPAPVSAGDAQPSGDEVRRKPPTLYAPDEKPASADAPAPSQPPK